MKMAFVGEIFGVVHHRFRRSQAAIHDVVVYVDFDEMRYEVHTVLPKGEWLGLRTFIPETKLSRIIVDHDLELAGLETVNINAQVMVMTFVGEYAALKGWTRINIYGDMKVNT